jgi:hypothetical protein
MAPPRSLHSLPPEGASAPFGFEPGVIKVQQQRFDKNHMFLQLTTS